MSIAEFFKESQREKIVYSNDIKDLDKDIVLCVIGESAKMSGEAHSRSMPGILEDDLNTVRELKAEGKKVIALVLSGRPLIILTELESLCEGLIFSLHGGDYSAEALFDIILGNESPSGKLVFNMPRNIGQIPLVYNHTNTGRPVTGVGVSQFEEAFKSNYIDESNKASTILVSV